MLTLLFNINASTAESTLSIMRSRLFREAGRVFDYGRSYVNWTTDQQADINEAVESAVRMVLFPDGGHAWSWLRPTTTLVLTAGTDTYTLPGNFGGFVGDTFAHEAYPPFLVSVVPEARVRRMQPLGLTGYPEYAGIRPLAGTGSASVQRWEVVFYPAPDAAYTLSYSYRILASAVTGVLDELPGGVALAELYLQAVRAACETIRLDQAGPETAKFLVMLALAIQADQKAHDPEFYGYNGDGSVRVSTRPRLLSGGVPTIILEGVPI